MVGLELKIGFADNEQVREFLKLLGYMQWSADDGHCANITVIADGDGSLKMRTLLKDPKDGKMKDLYEIMPHMRDGRYWDKELKDFSEWKKSQIADGIPTENIDRNEIEFDIGE